jgi:nitroreductase
MRAVRQFIDKKVDDETVTRVLEAGRWAGSAKNIQPWKFIVIEDRKTLERLAQCGRYASHLREAAFAIVIVSEPAPIVEFDSGRAAQNMMLAAWSLGIGSCIATMHQEDDARKVLGIPNQKKLHQAISFGYPDVGVTPTIEGKPPREVLASMGRKPLGEIVCYEHWMS